VLLNLLFALKPLPPHWRAAQSGEFVGRGRR